MTKYHFRFHRGHLDESMLTAKMFDSIADMKQHIIDEYANMGFHYQILPESIGISEHEICDHRIDWLHTHLVTLKTAGVSFVIGMLDVIDDEKEKSDIVNE